MFEPKKNPPFPSAANPEGAVIPLALKSPQTLAVKEHAAAVGKVTCRLLWSVHPCPPPESAVPLREKKRA